MNTNYKHKATPTGYEVFADTSVNYQPGRLLAWLRGNEFDRTDAGWIHRASGQIAKLKKRFKRGQTVHYIDVTVPEIY